ncbi:conserved hypothetical protein (plasmid) [Gloeothece citriformis PCC 7424]|uniref:Uncharacterized protein n=1 Tax=Gloeothece citriformis (strain PCC 7424) TaxID=65393 RepID=B7KMM9_GLOC7|nr:hypothetical protein [Gloeothece citriformis]ACK74051.1 conserved hypothetical protein [Gloeothece citriformis PCC 7424]
MDLKTKILHFWATGASAYILARSIRDSSTRPNVLKRFHLSESNAILYLQDLKERAMREGEGWLEEQLEHHIADKVKHSQMLARTLKLVGQEVVDCETLPVEEQVGSLFIEYFKEYPRQTLTPPNIDWIVFAGSTYILEVDSSKEYLYMAKALPENELIWRGLKSEFIEISQDKKRHANYCHEMLTLRLPLEKVESTVEYWRTQKTKALWSVAGQVISKGGNIFS